MRAEVVEQDHVGDGLFKKLERFPDRWRQLSAA
jgi:hypothetical protein